MSHRELLKKFTKLGVQGLHPQPGVRGVPAQTFFTSFAPRLRRSARGEKSSRGDPCNPPQGQAAPVNPAEPVVQVVRPFGMAHKQLRWCGLYIDP